MMQIGVTEHKNDFAQFTSPCVLVEGLLKALLMRTCFFDETTEKVEIEIHNETTLDGIETQSVNQQLSCNWMCTN